MDDSVAMRLLREYTDDVASRYYGRPATEAEIDSAIADAPNRALVREGFVVRNRSAGEAAVNPYVPDCGIGLPRPGAGGHRVRRRGALRW
ncbi:hypothetical protein GCM10011581_22480 [Saccharopolyspora subtropica]|uniref:Uncharacterized protein n=1 Tax=Saccharopolyspora thermophila TaxID=89367 RepID=A0A917JSJ0_9PSEU|nr:hypothetical protein GCM10011581_22480 [Saccharopolyspora subtropica]